jgi:hypothetical protein
MSKELKKQKSLKKRKNKQFVYIKYEICQLDLHNRIKTNPVAARAAERLITATL